METPSEVNTELSQLIRLTRLNQALPTAAADRHREISDLMSAWRQAEENLEKLPLNRTLSKIEAGLKKFNFPKTKLYCLYRDELKNKTEELAKKVALFSSDLQSIFTAPLTKSSRGMRGPTFIVAYPIEHAITSYVIKCADPSELLSNEAYKTAVAFFSKADARIGIHLPQFSGFDFKRQLHNNSMSKQTETSHEENQSIEKIVRDLIFIYNGQVIPSISHLLLQEFIHGENLLDFVKSKYKYLTQEQKENLFRIFGQISLVDLLFGDLDRLLRIALLEDGSYELSHSAQSNFGNLMFDFEHTKVYAIDNGIEESLIRNLKCRNRYLRFLNSLFTNPKWINLVAENIQSSLQNGLDKEFELLTSDLDTFKEKMRPFQEDLQNKEMILTALKKGLREMADGIKAPFIQEWAMTRLPSPSAQLHEAIEERLTCFIKRGHNE